jgi:bifunctional enzyme CysN/CysC
MTLAFAEDARPALSPSAAPDMLRVATAGSVDDGKSTLIGRLLYDAKGILEDQLEAVERSSRERGDAQVDLALLTDGLRAEREQGITIDVAHRYFRTPRRSFVLLDTPGHVRYTRNMLTGASNADVSLVLIDARNGVVEQSRRHTVISSLLGIPRLVACVNKMDLVDYDRDRFEGVAAEIAAFASKLGIADVTAIPVSALHGENVVERSTLMSWYDGPALLGHLEEVPVSTAAGSGPARFPVQWVIRPSGSERADYRGYAGRMAGGRLRPGDEVVIEPSGARSRIREIDTYDGPVAQAVAPMSVTLLLEDEIDISRGDLICAATERPAVGRDFEATVCWMGETPAEPGVRYVVKQASRTARALLTDVRDRLDVDTLGRDSAASSLGMNDVGTVVLRADAPLALDAYERNRITGSFILIDETTNDTVAAGMVAPLTDRRTGRSANVTWYAGALTTERRRTLLGTGATVWLTGLPAAGKSTLAAALEERLVEAGRPAYLLDGDNLRHGLNGDLGFDRRSRQESVRRTGEVARLLADAGAVAVVSLVSPYAEDRDAARVVHEATGLPFFEVWVDTPLEECERRDPKGLYARARRGELSGMTGIDDPYEAPLRPDLVVPPGLSVDRAVERIIRALDAFERE